MTDQEKREAFENWIADGNPNTIARWHTDGRYVSEHTAHDWRVWSAATAAARERIRNDALEEAEKLCRARAVEHARTMSEPDKYAEALDCAAAIRRALKTDPQERKP